MRAVLQHQFHKPGLRISLDIELGRHQLFERRDVGIPDMPLVGPRMHGDALRPEGLAVPGHLEQIWQVAAARVADQGYFVDVDAEAGHLVTGDW